MSTNTPAVPDTSARTAALVAGVGYVVVFVLAIYANFAVRMRLVEPDDAAATAQNIAQSATSVRVGVAAFTIVFLVDVAIAWALYVLFRPTGARRALHAAWFRLTYTVFLGIAAVFLYLALRLATDSAYRNGLGPAATSTWTMLSLEIFDYVWLIGLAAFGIHLVLTGRIIIISRIAPKVLGWTLVVAGTAYLLDTFAHIVMTGYTDYADVFLAVVAVPSVLGELGLTIWLLTRAGRTTPGAGAHVAPDGTGPRGRPATLSGG